jgi:hypothetical protein
MNVFNCVLEINEIQSGIQQYVAFVSRLSMLIANPKFQTQVNFYLHNNTYILFD